METPESRCPLAGQINAARFTNIKPDSNYPGVTAAGSARDIEYSAQHSPQDTLHGSSSSLVSSQAVTNSVSEDEIGCEIRTESTSHSSGQAFDNILYRDGQLVQQPAPSRDPRDPLNLTLCRKVIAVFCLCLFGAFAASAEIILGALLPIFDLVYADIDPKRIISIIETQGFPAGSDPLALLSAIPHSPPIWKVYLLASLPVLVMGVANLCLVPIAIAVGRRPVLLACGITAVAGCVWAGFSQSLGSHLAARAIQAVGAGTAESLIPFIIQDMVFVHERNAWISATFAAQGVIIVALGMGAPYIVIYMSWRWVYYITAAIAGGLLVGLLFFLPETKWQRTRAEMSGVPRDDPKRIYEPRTWKNDLALFHGQTEWMQGWKAFVDTLRTFFHPQIFFITMLNSALIAVFLAAGYTAGPALLTAPWSWKFSRVGLFLLPILIGAVASGFVTGFAADLIANLLAKKTGRRIPENQLLNLVLPTICALVGATLFGISGSNQDKYPWAVFLLALGLLAFGFFGANTVGAVYVLECFPHLAGPALVNIASFRCVIAFILSFKVSDWVAELGYFDSMMIYVGVIAGFALFIPIVYIYGSAWRAKWPAGHLGDQ